MSECSSSFGHLGDHRALDEKGRPWHWTDEDEPAPRESTDPSVTCPAHWFGFGCNLDPGHHGEHAAGYVQRDGSTGRVTWEGASIPREESTTDGAELAELLPSADRAAWLLHPVSSVGRETIAASQYEELRREANALRAERATVGAELARLRAENLTRIDAAKHNADAAEKIEARHAAALSDLDALYQEQVRESQRLAALVERYEDERDEARAEIATWREVTGADTPHQLSVELAIARTKRRSPKPCPVHAKPVPGLYCSGCAAATKGGS